MRTIGLGVFALVMAIAASGTLSTHDAAPASAQSGEAVVSVKTAATSVKKGDLRVPFDVSIENVTNIGSFQFDLTYDAGVFELTDAERDAEKGDFLGSSGRPVVCNPPIIDSGAGVTRFTCVTLGPTPKGANGSGKLATIYLHAKGSGSTDISLNRTQLTAVGDPNADPTSPGAAPSIPLTTQNTSVSVAGGGGGLNWLIWGPVIAIIVIVVIGGGGFAAMRMREGRNAAATAL